jgi:broad specificity phosphatase PhoE
MAPKIHLVRHAQGFHNLCQANQTIHDPLLTPRGKEQCTELQTNFPYHSGVDLIVSSPIRRTLYTSLLSFEHDIKTKGLTIIALPEVQETSDLPCDTGSSPEELAQEFAGKPIDFSLVKHGWNVKTGRWSPSKEDIAQRALEAREWLIRRPEQEIVVVTHGNTILSTMLLFCSIWLTLTSQVASCITSPTIGTARTSSQAPAGQTPSFAPTRSTFQGMR